MLSYPSMEAVENADHIQLGRWIRFLPYVGLSAIGTANFSQILRSEQAVMDRIIHRFNYEFDGWSPELSSRVGCKEVETVEA